MFFFFYEIGELDVVWFFIVDKVYSDGVCYVFCCFGECVEKVGFVGCMIYFVFWFVMWVMCFVNVILI